MQHEGWIKNDVSKGTCIRLSQSSNEIVRDRIDDTTNKKGLPQLNSRPLILIPSWTFRGIFNGDSKEGAIDVKNHGDVGPRKRKRRRELSSVIRGGGSRRQTKNLEKLVSDEIRQCDVCARPLVWTPTMEECHFLARDPSADRDSLPPKSVAETLPRFIDRHIRCSSPVPCSFCCGRTGTSEWCGSLFCSKECQIRGEGSVSQQLLTSTNNCAESAMASGASSSSFPNNIPPPKLFFCQSRLFSSLDKERTLVEEAVDSLSAIEQRFRTICGYDSRNSNNATMPVFGAEECALLLTTIMACIWPPWIRDHQCTLSSKYTNAGEEGLVEELWAMSRSHSSLCGLLQKYDDAGIDELRPSISGDAAGGSAHRMNGPRLVSEKIFPSSEEFLRCYLDIKRSCLLRVLSPTHPLVTYARETLISPNDLTEIERELALDLLKPKSPETKIVKARNNENDAISANSQEDVQSILRWRNAAHFSHWMSAPTTAEEAEQAESRIKLQMQNSYFAYHPSRFHQTSHSCAPTLALTIPDFASKDSSRLSPLDSVAWLALHDISPGESSVSKLDSLENDVHMRSVELKRLMGKDFVCSCTRCRYERSETVSMDAVLCPNESAENRSNNGSSRQKLKRLSDLAMQQGRFDDASTLYNVILRTYPHDGDVLHARAASRLGKASSLSFSDHGHCGGYFLEAQHLWKEAGSMKECSSHPEIAVQVKKLRVFKTLEGDKLSFDSKREGEGNSKCCSRISFASYLDGRCFVTCHQTSILSLKECQDIIDTAKQYAANDGWTTSRHYAMPTTDIPLHELTDLHLWFYEKWEGTIRPLLRRQFRLTKTNAHRLDIFLHDVFVVRYDAKQQRYLPPHYDESTHSFIIALNSDFKGGGTFIHSLDKTLAPTVVGGMTSFCGGELLHSGDPVVVGVRYIIAGFCFVDNVDCEEHSATSQKIPLPQSYEQSKLRESFTNNSSKSDLGPDRATGIAQEKIFSFGFNL